MAMDWTTSNDSIRKRTYPFGNENLQILHEEPPSAPSSTLINEPLCLLGSVVDVTAQLRRETDILPIPSTFAPTGPILAFGVSLVGDFFEINDRGRAFARLDKKFCSEARRLWDLGVKYEACLDRQRYEALRRPLSSFSTSIDTETFAVDINVYSLRHHADKIGNILLLSGTFLQCPAHSRHLENYYNPQILELDGFQERSLEVTSEPDETPAPIYAPAPLVQDDPTRAASSPDQFESILNSLSHTSLLHEIRTDATRIKSELMGHQMTALDFITQRESGTLPAELTFWREKRLRGETYFHHVLTNAKAPEPREAKGGIIADEPGLGKSLTMLSAIASSLNDAADFVLTWKENSSGALNAQVPSKATLIIVPSTVLLENWIDEIRAHTYPHKVTYHSHLGTDRLSDISLLLEKDVVFTTFATALEDTRRGQSPLSRIHWFRIVLDEAHKIRNRTTKQFQAVQQLPAQRRWCLTGTPIQNRLEDLGSLVAFLRIPDLERASTFRTCIIAPTLPDRGSRFQNLQILLRTICLRRMRDILGLPDPIAHPRSLTFSVQERHQYDELYEHYRKHVQMAVSGVLKVASTTLQSIHGLRLFCNNGPSRKQSGLSESDDETLSYLQQFDQNICAKCSLPIFYIDLMGDKFSGTFIPPCKHLVCNSCLPQCLGKKKACTLCASGNFPPDLAKQIDTDISGLSGEKTAFQYPSKLLALLHDIKREPGQKCIVFSSWKKTLDLAAELLKQNGLRHDIIHGSLRPKQRLKVLKDFKSIMGPNILLMTLGTGAEGLNLTIATRIYILEPQWNPFVEKQAMARAQRIGQTKQVVCTQYVMMGTIEQSDVLNRQKRKMVLAGKGFNKQQTMQNSLEYFGVHPPNVPNDSFVG